MFLKRKVSCLYFLLAATCATFVSPLAAATIWDESSNGDLSDNYNAPTNIGSLSLGDNLVIGALVDDSDSFRFFVPVGATLDGIILNSQSGTGTPNFYLIRGTTLSSGTLVGGLNWGSSAVVVGDNLLTKTGSGPVVSGNYEIALTGLGDNITGYTLNLLVASPAAATPEPAGFLLLPVGIAGILFARRFSRKAAG